ncbi:hypothetical protein Q8F55_004908 [Vanrija albida]|uniref:TauD/TfdA-like domain-containing protein n=1 Tax=Vanrija albida TaxID=181172 RepID=A0ABR3Q051_9TREE
MTAAVASPTAITAPAPRVSYNRLALGTAAESITKRDLSASEKKSALFDTSYEPSREWWASSQLAYARPEDDPLPEGFPAHVSPSTLWDGKVLVDQPEKWLYTFTSGDIALLDAAYEHFAALKVHKNEISRATFPLPPGSGLYAALREVTREINHGLGFRVLRGLPVDSWPREKQVTVFAGISAYLGDGARQPQGDKNITHLRDITSLPADIRPAIVVKGQTSGNQVFHTDGAASIVGLVTLGVAETGGLSQLSSIAATYNALANTRRDVLRTLAKPDWVTRYSPNGRPLVYTLERGANVSIAYSRRPFFGFYEADAGVPKLPEDKHLALDALHFTAERLSLDIDLQKGDLEFFNNHTVLHSRTASEDSEANARHLLRIYVANRAQEVPAPLVPLFDRVNDSGAAVDKWPLEAWEDEY